MPARINGIGTTYIGKRDVQTEHSVCESCGRAGLLSNYETRLWFTFLYVPVIPLTRRQILKYCGACTRHRAMTVDEWRHVQSEAIGSAMAKVDADPGAWEPAVECHATMAACGKQQEAGEYAETMIRRFGSNAEVQLYLGGWYERTGQTTRADACFERALKANPQHPVALQAAAVGLVQQNKPREAEQMLATLKPPSEHFDPSVFFAVAEAYQNVADHESTLRLLKMVAETTPGVAKEKKFRKAVARSEAALGEQGSVLAPLPWYKRSGILWTVIAATVLVAVVGLDRYFAQYRELFVVNGLPQPLQVRLDAGEPFEVPTQGHLKLTAAEGPHTMTVVEPAALARDEQFTIEGDVLARWRGRQVNIVDPTHSAVVVWEEVIYAADARNQGGDFRLHAGEPFLRLNDIDHKFEAFPNQIQVSSSAKTETRHRVGLESVSPIELLVAAPESLAGKRRLDFLEAHLATSEQRAALLPYYWQAAVRQNQLGRSRDYLKRSLGERPVNVEWHRFYQTAADNLGQNAALVPEYDAMLAREPDNADLLYLRGRIEPFGADSAPFFDAALRNDPQHSYTWSAKSFGLCTAGRFDEALAAIEKALEGHAERSDLGDMRRRVLQSLGRHEQVVRELREEMKSDDSPGWAHYPDLIDALVVQGNLAEADQVLAEFAELVDREWPQDPMQLKLKNRLRRLLAAKNYAELRDTAVGITDPLERSSWLFTAQLCDGRPQDAATELDSQSGPIRGIDALCLSVAWRNIGEEKASQQWLTRAIDQLANGSSEERIVAEWLQDQPADV